MKYSLTLVALATVLGLGACTGPMGPQGNTGTGDSTILVVPPTR